MRLAHSTTTFASPLLFYPKLIQTKQPQTHDEDIIGSNANEKCSIHHWANHGIAGRGVLLDYRSYALANNKPYDPYSYVPIS